MTVPQISNGGAFATARGASMDGYEVAFARQQAARGVSFQNIARMIGRSVEDVQRVVSGGFATAPKPKPKPIKFEIPADYVSGDSPTKLARKIAKEHGLTLEQLRATNAKQAVASVRRLAMVAVRRAYPNLSWQAIGDIFNRHHTTVIYAVKQAEAGL
jgi:hypothetical protein